MLGGPELKSGGQLQECDSVETATRVMDVSRDRGISVHGELLRFEYSTAPQPPGGAAASSALDWVCPQCQATNFSRYVSLQAKGFFGCFLFFLFVFSPPFCCVSYTRQKEMGNPFGPPVLPITP